MLSGDPGGSAASLDLKPLASRRRARTWFAAGAAVLACLFSVHRAGAEQQKWAASWAAAAQGCYPLGAQPLQPDLRDVFKYWGSTDQTFRLIIRPDLWGRTIRLRFSNAFGDRAVTLDNVFVGLKADGGNLVAHTNRAVAFHSGQESLTLAVGETAYSDAVELPYIGDPLDPELPGRKLAISFHVAGFSGPMTWHAEALTTSYLTASGAGIHSPDESDFAFRFTTTSWYFLDRVDVMAAADAVVIAAFGDSITDGEASTPNGDDRWSDVLSRRLHAAYGTHVSIVNEAIAGNMILGPPRSARNARCKQYGPSALDRLDRDVLSLSGLSAVIWLEGINDLGSGGLSAEQVIAGLKEGVRRIRTAGPFKVIGATLTPTLNSPIGGYGSAELDQRRQAVNRFILTTKMFDGVADFDAATRDPNTGALYRDFQPSSYNSSPGDLVHPNRAGFQAMGAAIDIGLFAPSK